ncbi:hypothetical protein SAMN04489724_1887 [Algoriphagus locisalis]|uniref:DUF1579 domain-containing protein n=1 Tax=Algoriphagus locisalis TaxID=305507 RepID=A0A1I7ADU6_9BACT|nr:hypothetical protein [Algoriphagus locisalis]SFT73107.1 hypothetical protein SAMN04489724_1887 [Algoriphagus locisalis]
MKKLLVLVFLFVQVIFKAGAQNYETDTKAKQEVIKLNFLTGKWKGTGWMMGQDMNKHTFDQTENVQFKLDSTAILVEGKGVSNGKTVQEAMAIITSQNESNQYDFQSFLPSGQKGTFKSELINGAYYWYPTDFIRYIMRVNEKGQWFEIGEINKAGTWYQFFEMTLEKIN